MDLELDFSRLPDEVAVILSDQSRTRQLAYSIGEALDLDEDGVTTLHHEMRAAIIAAVEPYAAR